MVLDGNGDEGTDERAFPSGEQLAQADDPRDLLGRRVEAAVAAEQLRLRELQAARRPQRGQIGEIEVEPMELRELAPFARDSGVEEFQRPLIRGYPFGEQSSLGPSRERFLFVERSP